MKGNPFHLDDGHDSFLYTFNKYGKLRNSMLEISNLRKKPEGGLQWAKVTSVKVAKMHSIVSWERATQS